MSAQHVKNVGNYTIGLGAFESLPKFLKWKDLDSGSICFVDSIFKGELGGYVRRVLSRCRIYWVDTAQEPSTGYVDEIVQELTSSAKTISAVVGVGGGATLDIAKAVSNPLANGGKASDYQGWDLVKNPAAALAFNS